MTTTNMHVGSYPLVQVGERAPNFETFTHLRLGTTVTDRLDADYWYVKQADGWHYTDNGRPHQQAFPDSSFVGGIDLTWYVRTLPEVESVSELEAAGEGSVICWTRPQSNRSDEPFVRRVKRHDGRWYASTDTAIDGTRSAHMSLDNPTNGLHTWERFVVVPTDGTSFIQDTSTLTAESDDPIVTSGLFTPVSTVETEDEVEDTKDEVQQVINALLCNYPQHAEIADAALIELGIKPQREYESRNELLAATYRKLAVLCEENTWCSEVKTALEDAGLTVEVELPTFEVGQEVRVGGEDNSLDHLPNGSVILHLGYNRHQAGSATRIKSPGRWLDTVSLTDVGPLFGTYRILHIEEAS